MTGLFFKPKKESQYLGGHMKGFHCSLRKHPFLLALRRWDVSHGGKSPTQRQKFHTDDANQCLHHKSGSHGVPNICPFLRVLWSILVNCCVYLPTISSETQMLRLEILYSTNINCFVRDSSRLHLTFVAFCLLSVIRKQ